MSGPTYPEPQRLPGPPDGWTRAREVKMECLALDEHRPDDADAALAALGEINRLRPLADIGLQAAQAWMDLEPNARGDMIEHGEYVAFDRLAEAHGFDGDDEQPAGGTPASDPPRPLATVPCDQHGAHDIGQANVVRIILALSCALLDRMDVGERIVCPLEALNWARSPEMYTEHADARMEGAGWNLDEHPATGGAR